MGWNQPISFDRGSHLICWTSSYIMTWILPFNLRHVFNVIFHPFMVSREPITRFPAIISRTTRQLDYHDPQYHSLVYTMCLVMRERERMKRVTGACFSYTFHNFFLVIFTTNLRDSFLTVNSWRRTVATFHILISYRLYYWSFLSDNNMIPIALLLCFLFIKLHILYSSMSRQPFSFTRMFGSNWTTFLSNSLSQHTKPRVFL